MQKRGVCPCGRGCFIPWEGLGTTSPRQSMYRGKFLKQKFDICRHRIRNGLGWIWHSHRQIERGGSSMDWTPPSSPRGDIIPPYLGGIAVIYCGLTAKTGQEEMPGREPCLLRSHRRSSSRGRPSAAAVALASVAWIWYMEVTSYKYVFASNYAKAQRGTSTTSCKSGYSDYINSWSFSDQEWSLQSTCLAPDFLMSLFFTSFMSTCMWTG